MKRARTQKAKVYAMTEGNIPGLLLVFTLPMLVGNLFQQFYNMVDSIIVGKYVSSNALAAVGTTGSINFLVFSLSFGMAAGIGIVVSQYFGAEDDGAVRRSITNGMYVLMLSAVVMGVLGISLAPWVLRLLDTPEVILQDAITYMRMTCLGIVAVAIYNGISAILRALGDSRTPLYFLILSSVINILLDLLFVIKFDMSVFGVGLATVIAQTAAAVGSAIYAFVSLPYFKFSREDLIPKQEIMNKCIRIGIPIAFQNSLIAISCIVLQKVVNGFKEDVIAANTALSRLEQLVQQPFNSLGAAISAFTGQNMGAGKTDRVKKAFWISTLYVAIFSAIMLVLAHLFGEAMVGMFVDNEDVIEIGAKGLKITSMFYFTLGMIYVTRNILNGAGDAGYAMINGFMELIGRCGLSKPLTMIPALGVWGIFITTGLTWTITAIAGVIRYFKGKWKTKSIVNN